MNPRIQIPGVEIGDELGRGAHSIVYRARARGVSCAVKVPRSRGRWTRWVYREAVALARVGHPALPRVLEVGEASELPYLAMELVEGETLADVLRAGRIPWSVVADVAVRLADVLAAVHDAGLVHRDVKPRNIVLEPTRQVRLIDFGFAAPIERPLADEGAGTPGYAAPEQFRMPLHVDGRADLYSLGRVLYECLTGELPPVAALGGRDGILASLSRFDTPASLASIVASLHEPNPDDRYADARALWSDLEAARAGSVPRGPRAYETQRYAAPLIGRDAELDRLLKACADTANGGGSVFIVRGRRGSGKTRLLSAVANRAQMLANAHIVEARCREADAPLVALQQVFSSLLFAPGHARGTVEKALRAVAGDHLGPLLSLIDPRIRELLPEQPFAEDASEAFAEGVAEVLVRLGRRLGRLIISVDDLQWLDPASREVFQRLAHRVHETPILIVSALRTEGTDDADGEHSFSPARVTTLTLEPFSARVVAELVASHLGTTDADDELAARVSSLADGTPLGILETVGALTDIGALRPQAGRWTFDASLAQHASLSEGARSVLGRRVGELPLSTRRVLEAAAIIGSTVDNDLLARVMSLTVEDLHFALADARRASVLALTATGAHRFVHDSLREVLLAQVDPGQAREIHEAVGDALDRSGTTTVETLSRRARHLAAGNVDKNPRRVFAAARDAALAVLERFDNETALQFFAIAQSAADSASIALDAALLRSIGEAHLRVGAVDKSRQAFELALQRATSDEQRAAMWGRLAWLHQVEASHEKASLALERAFALLGAKMPVQSPRSVARTGRHFAETSLRRIGQWQTRAAPPSALLCDLHYQNARLGIEYGQPLRFIQSVLEAKRLTDALQPSRAQARARAMYGFVLGTMKRMDACERELAGAEKIAVALGDAPTLAFCGQLRSVIVGWAGDLDRSIELMRECIQVHGHWLELTEFCVDAAGCDVIEALRGRSTESWAWCQRTLDRLRRSHRETAGFAAPHIHRARAALAALGRDARNDRWLAEQIETVQREPFGPRGFYRAISLGPRARVFVESGDLGDAFEALVADYERDGVKPSSTHFAVSEYYVAVAHGRVHQALRAPLPDRPQYVEKLRRAAADLRVVAKVPLLKAHRDVIDGYIKVFERDYEHAEKLFAQAEALANRESCSWVLYAVARGRAHLLRDDGRPHSARDNARVAEAIAREHGAEPKARWVREEFALPQAAGVGRPSLRSSGWPASGRARKRLASILHVVRAPQPELRPEQQASSILDDLLRDLEAEHGVLMFRPDPASDQIVATRTRAGGRFDDGGGTRAALLRRVHTRGEPWPSELGSSRELLEPTLDPSRTLAFPLYLYETAFGAVCVERSSGQVPFTLEDRDLLELLSHQVPIALEIARLLAERTQLQATLMRVQKMDAIGELAGGVAHDFNNMLMVVRAALGSLETFHHLERDVQDEIRVISQAADRAAQLTRQLLAFSRHQPVALVNVDINATLNELRPMLQRIVGDRTKLELRFGSDLHGTKLDRAAFEQAVVNLCANARDAMPDGGPLTIATKNTTLDGPSPRRGVVKPGAYVVVEVSDGGHGMSSETVARIFDPFFTTKPTGGGTGLGLTTVYAFVTNSGGTIEVDSEPGRGTTFVLYFPRAAETNVSDRENGSASVVPRAKDRDQSILVVDDDQLVRESVRRVLQRGGYRVLVADGSTDALAIASQRASEISLVVLDVMMPGMTGPELARRLGEMNMAAKILFVSGFAPGNLPVDLSEVSTEMLLQKPFAGNELLRRVGKLLEV